MRRNKGSVSLFAALIFMIIVSLIMTTILSVRIEGSRVMVKTAASMALDSILSEYDPELFSEFGILLFDGKDGGDGVDRDRAAARITEYMSYNIDTQKGLFFAGNTDLYGIELSGVNVDDMLMAVDSGGLLWFNEAVDYEKYAKPIDLAAEYLGLSGANREADAVKQINDEITSCSSFIIKITDKMKTIIEKTDGIKCVGGIDFDNIEPTNQDYVKCFVTGCDGRESLGVRDSRVQITIGLGCYDAYEHLLDAESDFEDGKNISARKTLSKIKSYAQKALNSTNDVLNILGDMESCEDKLDSRVTELKGELSDKADILSDECLESISGDIDKIGNFRQELSEEIFDAEEFKSVLSSNKPLLQDIISTINSMDIPDHDRKEKEDDENEESEEEAEEQYNKIMSDFSHLESCMNRYSVDRLVINYDHLGESTEDTSILDTVEAFLNDGILGLVAPGDRKLSDKSIAKVSGLASTSCNLDEAKAIEKADNGIDKTAKKIIYNEYVMDHYNSFTDDGQDRPLDYEAEYIIAGEKSDRENLLETVLKLAAIRSGPNMLYIMTDSEKKDEAYALAATLVGFTGIDAAIRIVQYVIMYLWSYAEGLSDVKILLGGGKVPLKKTAETWSLTLENLLACKITGTSENQNGLDYETYLKFMIFTESDGKKSAYSMDLAELRMEQSGKKGFRFRDYIYGLSITTSYTMSGIEYSFQCQDTCKY